MVLALLLLLLLLLSLAAVLILLLEKCRQDCGSQLQELFHYLLNSA